MKNMSALVAMVCAVSVVSGCGTGYSKLAMVTRTNVGINIETTPTPAAEISVSRSEVIVAPVFQGGKVPSTIAGFSIKANTGLFQSSIGSAFAIGDASMTLTDINDEFQDVEGSSALTGVVFANSDDETKLVADMQRVCPVFFGTDTTTGLKLAWTGTAGQYPDRVNLGYNRKEGAIAPLTAIRTREETTSGTGAQKKTTPAQYTINAPSLIATVAVNVSTDSNPRDAEFGKVQFFATGAAATRLGRLDQIRRSVFEQVDPVAAAELFQDGPMLGRRLRDHAGTSQENMDAMTTSLAAEGYGGSLEHFYNSTDTETRKLRYKVAKDLGLVSDPAGYSKEIKGLRDILNRPPGAMPTDIRNAYIADIDSRLAMLNYDPDYIWKSHDSDGNLLVGKPLGDQQGAIQDDVAAVLGGVLASIQAHEQTRNVQPPEEAAEEEEGNTDVE